MMLSEFECIIPDYKVAWPSLTGCLESRMFATNIEAINFAKSKPLSMTMRIIAQQPNKYTWKITSVGWAFWLIIIGIIYLIYRQWHIG